MRPQLKIDDVIDFFGPVHKVKGMERSGWKERGIARPETVAAHGFGAASLAWLLASAEGADAGKAVKMILTNGLRRASLPDVTPSSMLFFRMTNYTRGAVEELTRHLPSAVREEAKALLEEYDAGETLEAQVAREADKLDTMMQAIAYERETGKRFAAQFFATYSGSFRTKTGKELYEQLRHKARRGFRLKKVYDIRLEEEKRG